jgi:hypothetical protein
MFSVENRKMFPSPVLVENRNMFSVENRKMFPSPVSAPGSWGPSPSTTANPLSTKPWFHILGPCWKCMMGMDIPRLIDLCPPSGCSPQEMSSMGSHLLDFTSVRIGALRVPPSHPSSISTMKQGGRRWNQTSKEHHSKSFSSHDARPNGTPTISLGACLGQRYLILIRWVRVDNH